MESSRGEASDPHGGLTSLLLLPPLPFSEPTLGLILPTLAPASAPGRGTARPRDAGAPSLRGSPAFAGRPGPGGLSRSPSARRPAAAAAPAGQVHLGACTLSCANHQAIVRRAGQAWKVQRAERREAAGHGAGRWAVGGGRRTASCARCRGPGAPSCQRLSSRQRQLTTYMTSRKTTLRWAVTRSSQPRGDRAGGCTRRRAALETIQKVLAHQEGHLEGGPRHQLGDVHVASGPRAGRARARHAALRDPGPCATLCPLLRPGRPVSSASSSSPRPSATPGFVLFTQAQHGFLAEVGRLGPARVGRGATAGERGRAAAGRGAGGGAHPGRRGPGRWPQRSPGT